MGSDAGSHDAPRRPASPSTSFYALSDDEEGEYDTITHTETGKGVKLLFSKSKVSCNKDILLHGGGFGKRI
jgi:hypothetical protein